MVKSLFFKWFGPFENQTLKRSVFDGFGFRMVEIQAPTVFKKKSRRPLHSLICATKIFLNIAKKIAK